jgi:hypothetical protein
VATVKTNQPVIPDPTYDILGLSKDQAEVILALVGSVSLSSGEGAKDRPGNCSDVYHALVPALYGHGEGGWNNPLTVDGGTIVVRNKTVY